MQESDFNKRDILITTIHEEELIHVRMVDKKTGTLCTGMGKVYTNVYNRLKEEMINKLQLGGNDAL